VLQALEQKFHLNLPWYQQYGLYLKALLFEGSPGPSIKFIGRDVSEIVAESLPTSIELGLYALLLSILVGLSLGLLAAAKRGTLWDLSSMIVAISGVSLPSFLVASAAIWIFAQQLGWFPAALWDSPAHKIMPSIVLGLRPAALLARMTRSSALEVLNQDYIRTARAKGLSKTRILIVHVLKNAALPVITIMGPLAATVLTGSFVVEHVFSVPGLASHFIQAVTNRDYPLIMGVTLVYACFLISANALVDLAYTWIDPRMQTADDEVLS
jgi:ABC-type dipeptide/oligopeptide/nickel transport system permease component